ncbi:MAG: chemotaxis protein MotB [Actinomycetota bacterium]|nr:chemotaxis protein MotB [Actinomycetota bacterium]
MSGQGGRRRTMEEDPEEHINHERWMVSYADMMTLLMVLFIVMFAISQVDSKKFTALRVGLASGFGAPLDNLGGSPGLLDNGNQLGQESPNFGTSEGEKYDPSMKGKAGAGSVMNPEQVSELVKATSAGQVKAEVENLKKAQAQLKKALAVAGVANGATFRFNEQGLVVTIVTDKVLFDSGRAVLLPGGRKILSALAPTLRRLPNRLSIDGHTDSNPISTALFPSNWELSTARATGVLRYLRAAHRIPFSRMFATGYADTRPLLTGKSAKALSANRRVEIIVVARVDDSLGRSVEQLGNAPESTAAPTPAATPSPTTSAPAGTPSASKPGTKTPGTSTPGAATPSATTPRTPADIGLDLPKIGSPFGGND